LLRQAHQRGLTVLAERDRVEEQRETYAKSLRSYVAGAWHIVEPASPFVPNWHIDAICEHLEAVSRGEIRRLLINIPPRCMKSLLVSVFWMTWSWTWDAAKRWLYASYAQPLSTRDSVKCRRIIESAWYRDRWGDNFTLTGDQNQKTRFENDRTGYRIATSVDGTGTGEGGDVLVADDPHNVTEALSPVQRETALVWWDETMALRLNNPKTGAKVIVMQRLHEGDLSGHTLQKGGYEHLMIPMEYEAARHCVTSLGWEDPRREENELLWPARFPREVVETAKVDLGTYAAAGQLQQLPAPRGGGYFEEDWFRWYDEPPKRETLQIYGASDYAVTEDGGDWTVHAVAGIDPTDNLFLLDLWRGQTASDVWIEMLLNMMQRWSPIEWAEEAGQIKKSVGPFIHKRMQESRVYCYRRSYPSAKDKATRAQAIRGRMAQGKVYLPRKAPWIEDLKSELLVFPAGMNDDQVDVLSLFGRMLARMVKGQREDQPPPPISTLEDVTMQKLWEDQGPQRQRSRIGR